MNLAGWRGFWVVRVGVLYRSGLLFVARIRPSIRRCRIRSCFFEFPDDDNKQTREREREERVRESDMRDEKERENGYTFFFYWRCCA